MLSSTDDANSVGDRSPLGGVSIWPGAVVAGGVLVSPPLGAWAVAQGGVGISPGVQGGVGISPPRAEAAKTRVSPTAPVRLLAFFMVFSLSP